MYKLQRSRAGAYLSIDPVTLGLFSLLLKDDTERIRHEGEESQAFIQTREELSRLLLLFSDAGGSAQVFITNSEEEEGKAKRHFLDTGDVTRLVEIYRRGGDA